MGNNNIIRFVQNEWSNSFDQLAICNKLAGEGLEVHDETATLIEKLAPKYGLSANLLPIDGEGKTKVTLKCNGQN